MSVFTSSGCVLFPVTCVHVLISIRPSEQVDRRPSDSASPLDADLIVSSSLNVLLLGWYSRAVFTVAPLLETSCCRRRPRCHSVHSCWKVRLELGCQTYGPQAPEVRPQGRTCSTSMYYMDYVQNLHTFLFFLWRLSSGSLDQHFPFRKRY